MKVSDMKMSVQQLPTAPGNDDFAFTRPGPKIRTFEDILRVVGQFGKWQSWIYFWVLLYTAFLGPVNFSMVFLQVTPPHLCIDGMDATEIPQQLPANWSSNSPGVCQTKGGELCTQWKYFPQNMRSTIVSQYDLVCDRRQYISHSFTAGNAGALVAILLVGQIQDKIGRTRTLLLAQITSCLCSVAITFAPTIAWFMVARFFLMFCLVCNFPTSFVLGSELTTAKYRSRIMGIFWCPYSIGATVLAVVAYFERDWRRLQLIISAPLFISFLYYWMIPESPRWLLVEGKTEKAERVLRNAAKLNGRKIPPSVDFAAISKRLAEDNAGGVNILALLKHCKLVAYTVILFYCWFAVAATFYGVSWYAAQLPASVFLTNGLVAFVEVPGSLSVPISLSLLGRKTAYSSYMFAGGCSLLLTQIVPAHLPAVTIALALFGKMCVKAAWTVVYVLTTEIYPTVLRGTGLCLVTLGATIGLAVAPYISRITDFIPGAGWLTMIILGGIALPAAMLVLILPETKGRKMADRLEQMDETNSRKMSRDVTAADLRLVGVVSRQLD